jgi:hypothetical protein
MFDAATMFLTYSPLPYSPSQYQTRPITCSCETLCMSSFAVPRALRIRAQHTYSRHQAIIGGLLTFAKGMEYAFLQKCIVSLITCKTKAALYFCQRSERFAPGNMKFHERLTKNRVTRPLCVQSTFAMTSNGQPLLHLSATTHPPKDAVMGVWYAFAAS